MIIRKAEASDAESLVRLRAIMLEQVIGEAIPERDLEVIEEFFRKWDYRDPICLVAEDDGKVIGCIAVSFYRMFPSPKNPTGLQAEVHNLAVYEEHRGKGVARALLSHVLQECRARGVGRISLYATAMGRPLYESFGFSCEVIVCPEMRLYYRDLTELNI
jgi:GNAT superfamily N-acetyltransferase